jgi:hypothetical protein
MQFPKDNSQKEYFFNIAFWHQWVKFWDFEKYGTVDLALFSINILWDRLISNYLEINIGVIGFKCRMDIKLPWTIKAAETRKDWMKKFFAEKSASTREDTGVH